ncbi:cache domain-containing sensor histidine kinase [Paenibacillus methanolicus]|uniref:Two-component system sensor histidine kinase YesM n=1 Tax=Paenibacillus methanolicus TaxID=582686 RepID=A0A5S5CH71_9BACL|nr:sensor histidine kinase [Paenibacillus methanolicus]TYP79136.1 two-component system sensor histidine kinase YesM [Paenibacillus methanolicus]
MTQRPLPRNRSASASRSPGTSRVVSPTNRPSWPQRLFYSISFKRRLWLTFVLLITVSLASVGTIAYLIAASEIQRTALQASRDTVNQSAQIVSERMKNIGTAVRALMFSDAFQDMMLDVQRGDRNGYYKWLSLLQPAFSQVKFNDAMIHSMLIATPIGDFYPTSNVRSAGVSFYESDLYAEFKTQGRGFWTSGHADPFFKDGERVVSLVAEGVLDVSDHMRTLDVFVVVNVRESDLVDLFMDSLSQGDKAYAFLDSSGGLVASATIDDAAYDFMNEPSFAERLTPAPSGDFFFRQDGDDYLVNFSRLPVKEEWMIVGVQSKAKLLAKLSGIKRATIAVVAGFVLLSLMIANRLTYVLLRPLFQLQRVMKRVEENDLDVRYESPYMDEVTQVGFRFNRMLEEIAQLIDDVKSREREKRRAEFKALTAQMDPHFFYNTLHTIHCKSVLGENEDVSEMILALSHMFQLSLSGGRERITLREELEHVGNYVAIQQKSYERLFRCRIEADPEALNCLVPKIMLQPLVENSILHGFSDRGEGGDVRVAAELGADSLLLTVEDNGSGFDPARVRERMTNPPEGKHGYALRNIAQRLQLFYGEDGAAFMLEHNESGGARITLRLPREEGGGREDAGENRAHVRD